MNLDELRQRDSTLSRDLEDLREQIEEYFTGYFNADGPTDPRTHLYGVYRITSRVKSYEAVVRKRISEPARYGNGPDDVDVYGLTTWMSDIIGIRIVVLAQRHKLALQRAIDRLTTIDLPIGTGIHAVRNALRTLPSGTRYPLWKYFNPPAAYLSSSCYYVRRTDGLLDSAAQVYPDLTDDERISRDESLSLLDKVLTDSPYRLKHKVTGYATLQTTLSIGLRLKHSRYPNSQIPGEVTFEVQLRTLLEDAWAEPEHSMSYKGCIDEETGNLMRSLGAQLQAADDLLQQVVDKWSEYDGANPHIYAQMSQNYPIRLESDERLGDRRYDGFRRDYARLYQLTRAGRYGDAYNHCTRMSQKYDSSHDPALVEYLTSLDLERALIAIYWREQHLLVEGGRECDAIRANPMTSMRDKFWASFRGSQIRVAMAELALPREDSSGPDGFLDLANAVDEAREVARQADTEEFKSTWEDLRKGYDVKGLRQDIALWASRALRKLGRAYENVGKTPEAKSVYQEAIRWAEEVVQYAQHNAADSASSLVAFAWNGIAYCSYLIATRCGVNESERRTLLQRAREALECIDDAGLKFVLTQTSNGYSASIHVYAMNDRELMICDTMASVLEAASVYEPPGISVKWTRGTRELWFAIYNALVMIELRGEVRRDDGFFRSIEMKVKELLSRDRVGDVETGR